ncbi:MAG TPA: hypothetical protein VND93_33095 [Myxococcales bacterium]|nr:hypothetical protein [Myxococcales bacterium]
MNKPIQILSAAAAALALTFALAWSSGAFAASQGAACCAMSTSRVDALLNPVGGGDEKFFSSQGGIPNVMLVMNTNTTMQAWPKPLCVGANDCNCATLDALGYKPGVTYPAEWDNLNANKYLDDWFRNTYVYDVPDAPAYYGNSKGAPDAAHILATGGTVALSAATACALTSNALSCNACLTTKGYYLDTTPALSRMAGNFLNLYSPSYVMARRVLKDVIRQIKPVHMAVAGYNVGGVDSPEMLRGYTPNCNQILNGTGNWPSNRQAILNALNNGGGGLFGLNYIARDSLVKSELLAGFSFNYWGGPVFDTVMGSRLAWTDPLVWGDGIGITLAQQSQNSPSGGGFAERTAADQLTVCAGCVFSSTVIITDDSTTSVAGGPNDNVPAPLGSPALAVPGCPECAYNDLDEIADWLWNNDVRPDYTNQQTVATYIVGVGVDPAGWQDRLFRNTARQGGGLYFNAQTSGGLSQALLSTFDHINSRATAFSSAAVATLQVQGTNSAAVVPRMSPRRDKAWSGELYRFTLWNEFVQGIEAADSTDGDLNDIYLVDKPAAPPPTPPTSGTIGNTVAEDPNGKFIKKGTSPATPAVPWWEAKSRLVALGHANRKIYTIVDRNGDGLFTSADMPLAQFSTSSPDFNTIAGYLGILGTGICPNVATGDDGTLLQKMGLTLNQAQYIVQTPPGVIPATPAPVTTQTAADTICVKALIQYVRAQDVSDYDEQDDGTGVVRGATRSAALGDIFHSSPATVDPPVDRFICDLGLHNQCVRTLYSKALGRTVPTPLAAPTGSPTNACGAPAGLLDAYGEYQFNNRLRDRVVLVGANDGMLHAFIDDHDRTEACVGGAPIVSTPYGNYSGDEAWAFIPPDILPRLQESVFQHTYLMDGDIMVRDIWEDANGDGTKQANEYHTVAVVAEGRGGLHYFALDVQFDAAGVHPVAPGFRWTFPQACSPIAQQFGKTLYSLSPKPPPIGPVLLDSASVGFGGTPVSRYGKNTVERWVTMLSGGWSPGLERGRGVYMVDVWNGQVNGRPDNLLWKWDFDPAPPAGDNQFARKFLTHSIVSPVAMVDYGNNSQVGLDGFFDTALFGDTGGQLWLTRMFTPGVVNAGTKLVDNWGGGRVFQEDVPGGTNITKRWPFFYITSTGIQPDNNALRAFVGTGNRYSLVDDNVGTCRFDNPVACSRRLCTDVDVETQITTPAITADFRNRWQGQAQTVAGQTVTTAAPVPAAFCATGAISATILTDKMSSCPTDGGTVTYDDVRPYGVSCTKDTNGNLSCQRDVSPDAGAPQEEDLPLMPVAGNLQGRNRFYGVWAYGGNDNTRMFDETRLSGGDSGWSFDQARLTDRPDAGNLANVTATSCNSTGCVGQVGNSTTRGWMYEYPAYEYKTAGGAALLASCVLWTNLYPTAPDSGVSAACATTATVRSQFFQADFITGAPNCAFGFLNDAGVYSRLLDRDVIAPPPEPGTAVSISPSGQIRYSTLLVEPGKTDVTQVTVSNSGDLLQSVYEVPVTQAEHMCRHRDAGRCAGIIDVP